MTEPPTEPPAALALMEVATEIERHVAATGWDQPPRLYALVDTADLVHREPGLAATLGLAGPVQPLTPIEQESLPEGRDGSTDLAEVLAVVGWPEEVLGCALALEVMWGEDDERPAAPSQARGEGRLAVAVLRDGRRAAVLRLRAKPGEDAGEEDLLAGEDLAPELAEALAATLEP